MIGLSFCLLLSCNAGSLQENAGTPALTSVNSQTPINEEAFIKSFVGAINAKDLERLKELVHPASLACITDMNRDFYDSYFSKEFKGSNLPTDCTTTRIQRLSADETLPIGSSNECKIRIKPISANAPLLLENDFSYPVRPTHLVQIEYGDKNKMIQVIQGNGVWNEVVPCPKPETVRKFKDREMKQ